MRKLNRPQPAPTQLTKYDFRTQGWTSSRPSKSCRRQIWKQLEAMQGRLCAYCERFISKNDRHIEHFFHKGQTIDGTTPYRHLTFEWDNLFGCCGRNFSNTCGHYKDRLGTQGPGPYNPADLIKPDLEDPCDFFVFLDTGVIEAKQGLSDQDRKKAEETIRVLNLKSLNGVRKKQIDIYKKQLKELEKISDGLTDAQLRQELDSLRAVIQGKEHQTAILGSIF